VRPQQPARRRGAREQEAPHAAVGARWGCCCCGLLSERHRRPALATAIRLRCACTPKEGWTSPDLQIEHTTATSCVCAAGRRSPLFHQVVISRQGDDVASGRCLQYGAVHLFVAVGTAVGLRSH
jgi:hypothetical protein